MGEQKAVRTWVEKPKKFNWRDMSEGFAKILLILMNILGFLIAVCTFCNTVVDMKILKKYGEKEAEGSLQGDIAIIILCVVIAGVSVLGCVSTIVATRKLVVAYVVSMLTLLPIEIIIVICVSMARYGIKYKVSEWLQADFFSNATRSFDEQSQHNTFWDSLQSSHECCGINGPGDYSAIGQHVSMSCCADAYSSRTLNAQRILHQMCLESRRYYTRGCEGQFLKALRAASDTLLKIAFYGFLFEVIMTICEHIRDTVAFALHLSAWLLKKIRNSVHVYKKTVKY